MKGDIIGVDIGGTNIRAILVNGRKVLLRQSLKTPRSKPVFINAITGLLHEFQQKSSARISHTGFGIAGVHDMKTGIVVFSPNIPFLKNFKIRELVRHQAMQIRHDNDVHCFLRAETMIGAAKNKKSAAALMLGTGVGGALYMNGVVVRGAAGSAGEFGHTIIERNQTLEMLASEKFFRHYGVISPKAFAQKAYNGDAKAKKLYKEFGVNVGIGCANIINAFNPEIIVLGGGISRDAKLFLPSARATMQKYVLSPHAQKTPVVVSKLGEFAGAIGAALLF